MAKDVKESDHVGKYITSFVIIYGVLQPAMLLLLSRKYDTIVHFTILSFAAGYQIYRFHKKNNRLYDDAAKLLLIIGTTLCAVLVDSISFAVGLISNVRPGINFLLILGGNLFWLSWMFGRLARKIYKGDKGNL